MKTGVLQPHETAWASLRYGDVYKEGMVEHQVNAIVTGPPYYQVRDYGHSDQIGQEDTVEEYIERLVSLFRGLRSVLAPDGSVWVNLNHTWAAQGGAQVDGTKQVMGSQAGAWRGELRRPPPGYKAKDLIPTPWLFAIAMQQDGWWFRSDCIWAKSNPMPGRFTDRPVPAHEYWLLFSKSERYYQQPLRERAQHGQTRSWRSLFSVPTGAYKGTHRASYPPALVERLVIASCPRGGVVLDPFSGTATTGAVAVRFGRNYVGLDLQVDYFGEARARILDETTDWPEPAYVLKQPPSLIEKMFGRSK